MFELVEGVRDIGGPRFLPFLPVEILPGPKDIGVVLLTFPNCDGSPAFGGWRVGALEPATDHPSG
jgi:hypothetical protein